MRPLMRPSVGPALALLCIQGGSSCASRSGLLPNVPLPTGGGAQVWADIAWDGGWRVQRHIWTGHARLLDENDVRRAWGSPDACRARLVDCRAEGALGSPSHQPLVVLLHGLWRTRDAMGPLKDALQERGFEVLDVCYPSTRRSIEQHAEQVAGLLNGLNSEGRDIHFVTHSLGALVTRALFARDGDPWREEQTLGSAVFIAAPHQGAALARTGSRIPFALSLYGLPARQIAAGHAVLLPTPPMRFLNIAAGRGTGGWNPLIEGDDDGVVGVSEAHLDGEEDFLRVEGMHTFVAKDPDVHDEVIRFLQGSTHPH